MRPPNLSKWVIWAIILFILISWLITGTSCRVLRKSETVIHDTVHVVHTDTVRVKIDTGGTSFKGDWYRTTYEYPQNLPFFDSLKIKLLNLSKDTIIIDTVRYNHYYPTKVIQEGGSFDWNTFWRKYDSVSHSRSDSTSVKHEQVKTSVKTTVLTWWQAVLLGAGGFIAFLIIYKILKLKIL